MIEKRPIVTICIWSWLLLCQNSDASPLRICFKVYLSQTVLGLVGRYAFPPDSTTSKDGSSQLLSGLHSQRHLSPCRNNFPGRTLVENQSEVALACLLPCRSDVPFIAPAVHHQCHLAATSQICRDFPLLFVSFSFLIISF